MDSTNSKNGSSSVSYLTPASDSQTLRLPWDVFLSFRGPDTRSKFISHLYDKLDGHGIRTFRDNPELRTGEVISEGLIKAIQGSKTYVVVFSENYAHSSWCLDELVEIYKCYQNMNRLVIGVYYNIDPSVVRHQTKSFEKAFEKLQTRFADKVNIWRVTLAKVADFSGQPVSAQRDESDIINEIVDVILREIKPKTLPVADYPVGLDSRVKDITTLLSSSTEGVIKFGIYGMGGMGKTTLAKALYNQLLVRRFKGSCFLADVREASGRTNGLVSLQQQLIDDFLRSKKKVEVHNVAEGTIYIENIICSESAKVLVLIDDVDNIEQYKSLVGPFASGSVVIITTRDEEILDKIKVEPKYRYSVTGLDDAESLELFTQHAFGNGEPDNNLMVLFNDILLLSGRLPLALKVFGSYLSTKSEDGWKAYIKSLQRNFNSTIEQKLIISLDALESDDPMLKKMFLDIACFFIGRKKKEVVKIMETYFFHVEHSFDILKKRCLLTVDNKDELGMHDLLRDMGRKVAQNKYPDNVGKHSRLWVSKDICSVLGKQKGTEEIEGIIPSNFHYQDAPEGATFTTKSFKRMDKLRFLYLKNVKLSGSFEEIFEDLRWFDWECCPMECLPSDFCPENLVILALRGSKMRRMWKLNMVPKVFEKLTTLDMSYSVDLITTPDFSKFPYLKTLNFKGCTSLEEVHISIGALVRLVSLDLGDCVNLRSLPGNICNLKALKSLNIGGCSTLLGSLTEVNAWGLIVWKLPNLIGHLSELVELNPRDDYHFPETVSYATPTRWDVFLCFRGTDTRETFSNRLYEALSRSFISIYMDNPEVRSRGKAITHILPQAIKESKFSVVVFSEDYAFSGRCLDELVEILRCHEKMQSLVIPVYYKIEPSDVRYQTGSFKEAFEKHQIRYAGEMEKVEKWRLSLTEVSSFSGIHITGDRDESHIISQISNVILLETKPRILHVAKYTVGLDSRVKGITTLLSNGTEGVIKFGIYGMGGVGKTTLAKALYNQLLLEGSFKHSCFLAEVREASRTTKGIVSLQQQLIDDVLRSKRKVEIHNVEEGNIIIKNRVRSAKVLVLIDDVDNIQGGSRSQDRKRTKTLFSFYKAKIDQPTSNVAPDIPTPSTNEQETSNVASNNPPDPLPTPDSQRIEVDITSLERDPGLRLPIWKYPCNVRDEIRRAYIKLGPYQPIMDRERYPTTMFGTQRRRFQSSWFNQFSWLEYSVSKDAAFCFPCFLFEKDTSTQHAFTIDGFRNWKRVNNGERCSFLVHVGSPTSSHNNAMSALSDLKNVTGHIDKVMNAQTSEEIKKNRLRLKATIEAVRWLSLQACALRGHDESSSSRNRGNLIEMIKLMGRMNVDIANVVLDNAPQNAIYTSPLVQKDVLHILASRVRNKIRDEVGNSKFCILVDEARDASNKEQMAIVLRFVDVNGVLRERFFDIVNVSDTTSATLKKKISDVLTLYNLSIQNIRGQGYDGASNMRGEFNGLQALFLEDCPYAYYVHCFAHRLQLALVGAAQKQEYVWDFFSMLNNTVNIVSASSKRHSELQIAHGIEIEDSIASGERETGRGANQPGTLQRAANTRWSSHYNSICSLIDKYGPVLTMLEKISICGTASISMRGEARGSLKILKSFKFLFVLHFMHKIMAITDLLCRDLQSKSIDILNAMDLVATTKELLQSLRESGFDVIIYSVRSVCEKFEIDIPDMSARYMDDLRSVRQRDDISVEHHYRYDVFNSAIDFQLEELNYRFGDAAVELLRLSSSLEPKNRFTLFDIEHICTLASKFYPADFDQQEMHYLQLQLEFYKIDVINHEKFQNLSTISELCLQLVVTGKIEHYSMIYRLICLVLTLPVSTATTERAFSAMKIV